MRTVAFVAWMLLSACHSAPVSGDRIRTGDQAPSSLKAADDQVVVGWIVRGSDCLACVTPAYELRKLRRTWERTLIRTVVVGDTSLIRSFLIRERLPHDVRTISEDALRLDFGVLNPPFMVVTYRGLVRAVIRTTSKESGNQAVSRLSLDSIVMAALGPAAVK